MLLTGASIVLEFAALLALRIKEPDSRARSVCPAGSPGAALIGVCPTLLLGFSVFHSGGERILGINGLAFGVLLMVAGFLAYWAASGNGASARLAAAPPGTPDLAREAFLVTPSEDIFFLDSGR